MGCTPMFLAQQSVYWLNWARIIENAENWAKNEAQAHALAQARNQR